MNTTNIKTGTIALVAVLLSLSQTHGQTNLEQGAEVVVAPAGEFSQWDPAAAFDGPSSSGGSAAASKGTYLVVWSDGAGNWGGDADIHGTRLKADGSLLDAKPIVIAKARDFQKRPRVAWTGKDWLVVWQDWRNGKSFDVYAARVTADGKVLDPDGIAVCTEKGDQVMPVVASDGSGSALVAWADYRGGNYDIYGAAVKDGKAEAAIPLIAAAGEQMGPSLVWAGKQYLVACGNGERTVGLRTPGKEGMVMSLMLVCAGADGKVADAKPMFYGFGVSAFDSAIAASGDRALLMGRQQSGKLYHPNTVYGIYLDSEGKGVPHENPGRPMFTVPLSGMCNPPPITLSGTGTEGSLDVMCPAVSGSGDWFLALHQEGGGGHKEGRNYRVFIRHQLINAKTGKVVLDGTLTQAGAREKAPGVAGGPANEFLVVYERNDAKEPNQRICARVVKVGGAQSAAVK